MTAAPAIRTGREAAMSVGGEKRIYRIGRGDFVRLAEDLGVAPAVVLRRVDALAVKLRAAAPALRDELARISPSPVYDRICGIVESQFSRFAES